MVEVRYRDRYEAADLAGKHIGEVREQYRSGFGIPDKARARLNGSRYARFRTPEGLTFSARRVACRRSSKGVRL